MESDEKNVVTDKWLILRFRQGSQEAFCRIFETYRDDLLRVAASLLRDKSVAEDLVHEVFMHLIRVRTTFMLTGSLRAYLMTCVANKARNANRDQRPTSSIESEPILARASELRRPDEWAQCSEQFERLRAAVMDLPYDQREVVALRVQGQLTFKEIAGHLGCSIKTVQSRYRYGLEKLRVRLNGEVQA